MGALGSVPFSRCFALAGALILVITPRNIAHSDCTHELLWSETYDSPDNNDDYAYGVAVDLSGNIVVVGSEYRDDIGEGYNWLIRKYDPAGGLLWSEDYNGPVDGWDKALKVAIDSSQNIAVLGSFGQSVDHWHWLIRKYDPAGDLLWSREFDEPGAYANFVDGGLAFDMDGNVIAVSTDNQLDFRTWLIRKYDPLGNLLWILDHNTPENEIGFTYGVATDIGRNIVVVGSSRYGLDWGIRKYDSAGNLLWSRYYDGPANSVDEALGVAIDKHGNICVVGLEIVDDESRNWLIRKYDSAGNLLWSRDYNSPAYSDDIAYGVAMDAGGNSIVAGYESRPDIDQGRNWLIRKYDPAGNILWSADYNNPSDSNDIAYGVAIDASGNIVVAGTEYRSDLSQSINWRIRKYACIYPPTYPYKGALRIFPNPFDPSKAVRGTVKFEGLDLGSQVRIYTVRGLLVWEGVVEQPYILEWNGRNEAGKPVAPGTYLWIAESVTGKERGSLIVE